MSIPELSLYCAADRRLADLNPTTYIEIFAPLPVASQPLFAGFSPRSGGADLEAFIAHIDAATQDVLFCTAFGLYDGVEEAL